MLITHPTGTLVETLSLVLQKIDEIEVLDYSSENDFRRLWDLEDNLAKRILIVWSQTALDQELDPIKAAACLTPVDWAVCYAAKKMDAPEKWPEVLILDLDPALHDSIASVAHLKVLKPDQLPWLRMEADFQLSTIMSWLVTSSDRDSKRCTVALQRFLREIKLNLTDVKSSGTYDRHAVSNIIGPMILRGQTAKKSLHSAALLRLLQACLMPLIVQVPDVVPDAPATAGKTGLEASRVNDQNEYPWSDWVTDVVSDSTVTPTGHGLGILLVDDQAEHGWADWVKESLPGVSMAILENPTALVVEIKRQLFAYLVEMKRQLEYGQVVGSIAKDLRFRFSFPGLPEGKEPILLLDLRLFSCNQASELAFYKETLCPLMELFTDKNDRAWPSFSSADEKFTAALAAVKAGTLITESAEHHEALTWLPRFLALADMSLPIVLFSSTDRKGLTTPLLPYKNVIISFQKPSLSSLSDPSIRTTTLARFKEAIAAAKTLGAMRRKCLAIQALAEQMKYKKRDKAERLHVELYVDESGDPKHAYFSVGGVFGVFSTTEDADIFEDLCVAKGLRYFKENLFEPNVSVPLIKNTDNGIRQLSEALTEFRTVIGKQISLGFVKLRRGGIQHNAALSDNNEDGRLHKVLSALVELFCSESLPAIAKQYNVPLEKISLSVFLGTRVVKCAEPGDYTYRGNVEIHVMRNEERMLRSMGGRDAFPIVRNALAIHSPLALISVERAIAVSLPYEGGTKDRIDRVIHRPSKAVRKFNPATDVEFSLNLPTVAAYGVVTNRPESRAYPGTYEYMFVSVVGLDENVFCFWRHCKTDIRNLAKGALVRLNVAKGERGLVGTNVEAATEDDHNAWTDAQSPKVAQWFLQASKISEYRPDYRALHYVADQVLWADASGYTPCIPDSLEHGIAGQFDADLDDELETSIAAGRSLDAGLLSDALRLFNESPARRNLSRPLARAYLAHRLWSKLADCGGEVLCVGLPAQPADVPPRNSAGNSRQKAFPRGTIEPEPP